MWGTHKENGIWIGSKSRRRLLFRKHDSLFVALGRLRLRIMKPKKPAVIMKIETNVGDYVAMLRFLKKRIKEKSGEDL